jgi:hypothetical protein
MAKSSPPIIILKGIKVRAHPMSISLPEAIPPIADAIKANVMPKDISLTLHPKMACHLKIDAGNI